MVTNIPNAYPDYIFEVRLGNSRQAQEFKHQGKTYIEGRKGSEYNLFFRNRTNRRVLVVMSVDGLSVMDGKAAGLQSSGYVVDAYRDITVPGWRIDNGKVGKFVFQPQGDKTDQTYVEAMKADGINVDTGNQGVIGCLVFPEKPYIPPMRERYSTGFQDGLNTVRSLGLHQASGVKGMSLDPYSADASGVLPRGFTTNSIGASLASASAQSSNATVMNMHVGSVTPTVEAPLGTGMGEDKTFATTMTKFEREDANSPAWKTFIIYDTLKGLHKRGVPVYVETKESLVNAFPASPNLSDGCYVPRNRR
jgi:hypothetical protein